MIAERKRPLTLISGCFASQILSSGVKVMFVLIIDMEYLYTQVLIRSSSNIRTMQKTRTKQIIEALGKQNGQTFNELTITAIRLYKKIFDLLICIIANKRLTSESFRN